MTELLCPNCSGMFYLEQEDSCGNLCSEKCAKEYQEFVESECERLDGIKREAMQPSDSEKITEFLKDCTDMDGREILQND